jgi:osmotically-inducible protein OsmY
VNRPHHPSDDDWSSPWSFRLGPAAQADEELALTVAHRLRTQLPGADHRIVVEVQNRVVILEGIVSTDEVRRHAHDIARSEPGVFDMCNQLAVWFEDPDDGYA